MTRMRAFILSMIFVLSSCCYVVSNALKDECEKTEFIDVLFQSSDICEKQIVIPTIYKNDELVNNIGTDIQTFWEKYISSFGTESLFDFKVIAYQSREIISIVYFGEVYTNTKAIPQCIAFNYELGTFDALELQEIIDMDRVVLALKSNQDNQIENTAYNFEHFRTINGDINHCNDFFIRDDTLYVIVSISSGGGTYTIEKIQ